MGLRTKCSQWFKVDVADVLLLQASTFGKRDLETAEGLISHAFVRISLRGQSTRTGSQLFVDPEGGVRPSGEGDPALAC